MVHNALQIVLTALILERSICKFFSLLVGPYLLPFQIAPSRKQIAVHIVKHMIITF